MKYPLNARLAVVIATAAGQCGLFRDTVTDGALVLVHAVNEAIIIAIVARRHFHELVDPYRYRTRLQSTLYLYLYQLER